MPQNFDLIDPHIHYWHPATTPRTVTPLVKLLGRFPRLMDRVLRLAMPQSTIDFFNTPSIFTSPYLPENHFGQAKPFNLRGVVHIQADWQAKEPLDMVKETVWLEQLDRPPLAIVGDAHLHDGEHLAAVLDGHAAASNRFRGIRDIVAYHPSKKMHAFVQDGERMRSAEFRAGFAELGRRGLTFDAYLFATQLNDLCDLVEAVPNTAVVVDHFASPLAIMGPYADMGETAADRETLLQNWRTDLKRLARYDHVHIKLSGIFMSPVGWTHTKESGGLTVAQAAEGIRPLVEYTIDTFGIDRCMFASNFPVDLGLIDFETLYQAYFEIVKELDEASQRKLFFDNAKRFYNIEI